MSQCTFTDAQAIFLKFLASLTLADHLGDVWNDVDQAIEQFGIDGLDPTWEEHELQHVLGARGVTTLYGTVIAHTDPHESAEYCPICAALVNRNKEEDSPS